MFIGYHVYASNLSLMRRVEHWTEYWQMGSCRGQASRATLHTRVGPAKGLVQGHQHKPCPVGADDVSRKLHELSD